MYILGVSAFFHDSAATLIKNGEIICAIEEEKFTRIKHDHNFPNKSIAFCLEFAQIDFSQIQSIIFYDKPLLKFDRILETVIAFAPRGFTNYRKMLPEWVSGKLILEKKILKEIETVFGIYFSGEIKFSEHHLSHAASAFFPSNFENSAILCIDGVGEWATVSAWIGKSNQIKPLWMINFPHSLGLLYSAFTQYLGFKVNEGEYKVMGLAPYGQPVFKDFIKSNLIDIQNDGTFMLNMNYFDFGIDLQMVGNRFEKLFGNPIRKNEEVLNDFHKNIAASIQAITEEVVIKLARKIQTETGATNLCLAGGVALNCVANGKLEQEKIFEKIWVQPASSDSGGSLGAALAYWHMGLNNPRSINNENFDNMKKSLLGPHYSNDQVKELLDQNFVAYDFYENTESMYEKISYDLSQGKVIGWFQGRAEFGPRALGSRSIIADPRPLDMQNRINLKIKFRESFRPFAPILLEEDLEKYFFRQTPSPYMLFTTQARRIGTECSIPAVVHIDGSSRVQTVSKDSKIKIRELLESFKALTQESILVNTSFNGSHEPIVLSPHDALVTFLHTDLDILVLEDYVIRKENLKNLSELKKKNQYMSQLPDEKFFPAVLLNIDEAKDLARKISIIIGLVFGIVLPIVKNNHVSNTGIMVSFFIIILSYNGKCAQAVCYLWNLIGMLGHRLKKEILLFSSFYLLFTPIALFFKLTNRDFLNLNFSKKKNSYQILCVEKDQKFNSY